MAMMAPELAEVLAAYAFLVWLAYFAISRTLRPRILRMLASTGGLMILLLPLAEFQAYAIGLLQAAVIMYDVTDAMF
jgi:uncharacterized membrane protein